MDKILTTALPYANGDLHWGHFYEAVIADIYAKYNNIPLISGDDQHGAAITLFVEKNKLDINQHLYSQHINHKQQYSDLGVDFSYFGETSNPLHKDLVLFFYKKLQEKNLIVKKKTISWFDVEKKQFLPDRYVRGVCPHCHKENVFPHVCEHCNTYFNSDELINPKSSLSNSIPILKETEHFFLDTKSFFGNLEEFCNKLNIHSSVRKKILDESLQKLDLIDITRDLPYFGIQVPEHPLAFYVWFDAPLGYLTFVLDFFKKQNKNLSFEELIEKLQTVEFEHTIGKDIVYFHTFFWLNLLNILDLPLPKKLHVHGWIVQDNGEKYSKSNGDKLDLKDFSTEEIDAIRFFFSSIYDGSISDNQFSLNSSYEIYNQFIVGKFSNIYSRISKLLINNNIHSVELLEINNELEDKLKIELSNFHLKNFTKTLFLWIDQLNTYIQEQQPWKISDPEKFKEVSTKALSEFKVISYYVGLICPNLKKKIDLINYSKIEHIHLSSRITKKVI